MKKLAACALLLLSTFPALAQSRYAQPRELAFEVLLQLVSSRSPGTICPERPPTDEQRQAIGAALAQVDPPTPEPPDPQYIAHLSPPAIIDETTWLDPLILAVIADDTAMLERMEAAGHPLQERAGALLRDAAYFGSRQSLDYLLARGAPVDAQSDTGATALIFAASQGWRDIVETLLQAGASPHPAMASGKSTSALTYTMFCRNQAIVDLLLQAGANVDERTRQLAGKFGMRLDAGHH